jgi:hypothetical protein
VKLHSTLTTVLAAAVLAAAGIAIAPATAAAAGTADGAAARPGAPGKPKVVKIKSNDHALKLDDAHFRPGVTEFRVKKTAHRGSTVIIVKTENLDRLFKKFGQATSGAAGSADAMKTVDRIATFYGGGAEGSRWQVRLGSGSYFLVDTKTNQVTSFRVKGERRSPRMAKADSAVWATKQNQFETSGDLTGRWVSFENRSHEIHFLEANRVADGTTASDVRKAFKSPGDPKWALPGGFMFDIQSPGIKTVHRQDVRTSRYLLMCWMPSEEQDGVPHAMMGMWHLVNGG